MSQITLILTAVIVVLNFLFLTVVYLAGATLPVSISQWLTILLIAIIPTYLLIRFLIEFFVFRKIKVIYKLIDERKQRPAFTSGEDVENTSFDKIQDEVTEWAESQKYEMNYLLKLEQYRRNFLGNISHELKTPLFAIQGYLLTLLEGGMYDENINAKYLRKAVSNVDRLRNIVEDLDIINQFESGQIKLNIEEFDLKELSSEVIDDLGFMAKERNIELQIKENVSKPLEVIADRGKVRQVLYNLIANAVKYGKKNGHVLIGFAEEDDKIITEVEDDGIGIEEEHLNHLFDRFYRVEQSRSRKQGGSGLGLSIVKHIIEAHEQSVSVNSVIGEGSVFRFTLDKS